MRAPFRHKAGLYVPFVQQSSPSAIAWLKNTVTGDGGTLGSTELMLRLQGVQARLSAAGDGGIRATRRLNNPGDDFTLFPGEDGAESGPELQLFGSPTLRTRPQGLPLAITNCSFVGPLKTIGDGADSWGLQGLMISTEDSSKLKFSAS
jgi:hypothetical protein